MSDFVKTKPIFDRSLLEAYHNCPEQGRLISQKKVNTHSVAANQGSQIHDALSAGMRMYVEDNVRDKQQIADEIKHRADVNPWPWLSWLTAINVNEIVHYDGGMYDRSGQLSVDLDEYVISSELDFVRAGRSPESLEIADWKTGWKHWSAGEVADSFQFGMHAWLLWHTYPDIHYVDVRIWMSRFNAWTPVVQFNRQKDFARIDSMIQGAALEAYTYTESVEAAPLRPAIETCRLCPAAHLCPAAGETEKSIAADPEGYLRLFVAIDAMRDKMAEHLTAYVDKHGTLTAGELHFGRERPKRVVKPRAELW